jgi:acyl carrier protein
MTSFDVLATISDELALESVSSDQVLGEIGVDSLDYVDLILKLEKESGLTVPEGAKFRTVGALVDYFAR